MSVVPFQRPFSDPVKPASAPSSLTAKEFLLGELRNGADLSTLVIAPNGQHVAYRVRSGFKQAVVLDNEEGRYYNSIAKDTIRFSADSRRLAYVARSPGGFLSREKSVVVVDGQEEEKYDWICRRGPVFSPNSRTAFYGAALGGKWFMASGQDKSSMHYDDISGDSPNFSPDSGRIAYKGLRNGLWRVIVDEREGKPYHGIAAGGVFFSPDSRRVAYGARLGGDRFIVVDGAEEKRYPYSWSEDLVFSPDSLKLAYRASRYSKQFVVAAGEEHIEYAGIGEGSLTFSPDSRHVAYGAKPVGSEKWQVILDHGGGALYDAIAQLEFSNDAQHLGFVAFENDHWFVVLDRQIVSRMTNARIWAGQNLFSPDCNRVACAMNWDGAWRVVVYGTGRTTTEEEGEPFEEIWDDGNIVFSPDGRHLAYWARQGSTWNIVVDQRSWSGGFDRPVPGSSLVFSGPATLHALALRGKQLVRIQVSI